METTVRRSRRRAKDRRVRAARAWPMSCSGDVSPRFRPDGEGRKLGSSSWCLHVLEQLLASAELGALALHAQRAVQGLDDLIVGECVFAETDPFGDPGADRSRSGRITCA